jgi:hypothetical protein
MYQTINSAGERATTNSCHSTKREFTSKLKLELLDAERTPGRAELSIVDTHRHAETVVSQVVTDTPQQVIVVRIPEVPAVRRCRVPETASAAASAAVTLKDSRSKSASDLTHM